MMPCIILEQIFKRFDYSVVLNDMCLFTKMILYSLILK